MTKQQCEYAVSRFNAIRKIAGKCFTIGTTLKYMSSKEDQNSWSIHPRLLGANWYIYNVEDAKTYFYKAKAFFMEALKGEIYETQIGALEF